MKTRALVAEFIGTFFLCFVGILAIKNVGAQPGGLLGIALAHGLTIGVMVCAFAQFSGGHFNPAVSFGVYVSKKMDMSTMIAYWVAQIVGGAVAGLVCLWLIGKEGVITGTPAVTAPYTAMQAAIAEVIGTFALVIVVLGSAIDKKGTVLAPFAIGLSITCLILAVGPISGCAINVARMVGPALVTFKLDEAWLYIAGPLIGGGIAGALYGGMFAKEDSPATT